MSTRDQIRKGSTTLLILSVLADEPMYGYQIIQELEKRSDGYFKMKEGLLYPLLHRMKREGLLSSQWHDEDGVRRRKYYTITANGRRELQEQSQEWRTFIDQMQNVLSGLEGS
jgi:PadR family transcriptional regulator, regulatory protein PadR